MILTIYQILSFLKGLTFYLQRCILSIFFLKTFLTRTRRIIHVGSTFSASEFSKYFPRNSQRKNKIENRWGLCRCKRHMDVWVPLQDASFLYFSCFPWPLQTQHAPIFELSRQIPVAITLFVKLGSFKKTLSSDYEKNVSSCADPARLVSTMVGQERKWR